MAWSPEQSKKTQTLRRSRGLTAQGNAAWDHPLFPKPEGTVEFTVCCQFWSTPYGRQNKALFLFIYFILSMAYCLFIWYCKVKSMCFDRGTGDFFLFCLFFLFWLLEGNLVINIKLIFWQFAEFSPIVASISAIAVMSAGGSQHMASSFQPEGGGVELGCKFLFCKETWLSRCQKRKRIKNRFCPYIQCVNNFIILDSFKDVCFILLSMFLLPSFLPTILEISRNRR